MALSEKEREYIKSLFNPERSTSMNEIRDSFKNKFGYRVSEVTINKIWKTLPNYISLGKGGFRNGMRSEEFRAFYDNHQGNIEKMAEESGMKLTSLVSRCYELSLKPKNIPDEFYKRKYKRVKVCDVFVYTGRIGK
jgi:hypothetical protein